MAHSNRLPINVNPIDNVLYTCAMRKKSSKPKLKSSPSSPHVEVKDQTGTSLPVNNVTIQEDAEGIFLIQVEVQLPVNATFYHNDNATSSFPGAAVLSR